MPWRSKPDLAGPEGAPAPEPTAGEDELARRLEELTHREVALRRITEVVERQRSRLEERERALQSSTSRAAADADKRLAQAVRRAEQAEQRVRDLEQQVAALELAAQAPSPQRERQRQPEPEVRVAVEPAAEVPVPPPPVEPGATGSSTYTLQRLERLVYEAQLRGDPQAEEWAVYLPLLREHAEPDGRLPAQFAPLVDSIFAA